MSRSRSGDQERRETGRHDNSLAEARLLLFALPK
jgi:hypothetical protein